MKKFYAFLAATVLSAGMSAMAFDKQMVSKGVKASESSIENLNITLTNEMPTGKVKKLTAKDVKYHASREDAPLSENWFGKANILTYNQLTQSYEKAPQLDYCLLERGEGENEVLFDMDGFFSDVTMNPFKGTLEYRTYGLDDEPYSLWVYEIPAGVEETDDGYVGPTVALTDDDKDYYLCWYGSGEDGNYYVYTGMNVSFALLSDGSTSYVYESEGDLYIMEDAGFGFFRVTPDGRISGWRIVDPVIWAANATQSGWELDPEDQYFYEFDGMPVWTSPYQVETEDGYLIDVLFVTGFQGLPEMFYILLDKESNYGIADEQVVTSYPEYGDFYLTSDFTGDVYELECELSENEKGQTVLTFLGEGENNEWWAFSPEGNVYWTIAANTVLTLDYNYWTGETPDGVKDINVDSSANAAAVYYNLQGMQVANPQAGQIYIVKQGSKVSKQIIK